MLSAIPCALDAPGLAAAELGVKPYHMGNGVGTRPIALTARSMPCFPRDLRADEYYAREYQRRKTAACKASASTGTVLVLHGAKLQESRQLENCSLIFYLDEPLERGANRPSFHSATPRVSSAERSVKHTWLFFRI